MIRPCTETDFDTIFSIINEAAEAHGGGPAALGRLRLAGERPRAGRSDGPHGDSRRRAETGGGHRPGRGDPAGTFAAGAGPCGQRSGSGPRGASGARADPFPGRRHEAAHRVGPDRHPRPHRRPTARPPCWRSTPTRSVPACASWGSIGIASAGASA
jgi:hypothetical protein